MLRTEVANNGYRDGFSNLNNTEDSFVKDGGVSVDQRKMNAVRAYFEWMPIRQVDLDDNLRIWRSFQLGKLVDLIIIDTRNYDRSITSLGKYGSFFPPLPFPTHTICCDGKERERERALNPSPPKAGTTITSTTSETTPRGRSWARTRRTGSTTS